MEVLNLTTMKWRMIASMKSPKRNPGVFAFEKKWLYTIGGCRKHDLMVNNEIEKYDIR